MSNFCIGDRVKVTTVDEYDIARKISVGDIGVISYSRHVFEPDCVFVDFYNGDERAMLTEQLEKEE